MRSGVAAEEDMPGTDRATRREALETAYLAGDSRVSEGSQRCV